MSTMTLHNDLEQGFIQKLIQEQAPVSIYLKNGIQLRGFIAEQDDSTFVLKQQYHEQLVYKYAIATIMPAHTTTF